MKPHIDYTACSAPWISIMPAHWQEKPLFAVAKERRARNTGMQENNLLSLSYGRIVRKDINTNEGLLPESFETYQIVEATDVVFRLTDLQNDKRSLRSAMSEERGIVTSAYLAVVPHGVSSPFFNYLMRAYDVQKVFYSMGGGMRQSLKYDDLRRMPVLIPSEDEQSRIVAFLDRETARIHGLIEKKIRFITILREKLNAQVIHATRPRVRWQKAPFWSLAVARCVSGMVNEGLLSVYLDRGVIPYSEGGGLVHKPSESLEKYQLVEPGDFVMNNQQAWRGSVGVSAHRGIVSPAYHVFNLDCSKIDPRFANYAFRSKPYVEQFMLASLSVGDIQRQIKWHLLRRVTVSLPPLDEQHAIISQLDRQQARIEKLIANTKRSIELLTEHRFALISAAVTGKIDVRSAA